ncbi:MAG: carboxypeptidase regulatory-like domain-containing protein [Acidobacteriaceae bacterium]
MLLTHMPLHAQSDTGRIVGTVTDMTGAAIPGANITVTNNDNGLQLKAISNSAGGFNIFAVPIGNYTARIESQGFQSQTQPFTLSVTQVQTLLFKLQPGTVSTTVKVSDAAPLINATDASTGETIRGKQITQLPLNGRNFVNLAYLTPGVTTGSYGDNASGVAGNTETIRNNEAGGGALSVNGVRMQANNFILDGIDDNEGLVNTILIFPPIDALEEFRVITSVAPAQYGRGGGAMVVSSIKSGTNKIHGSAFEFYRSGKFDSNPNYRFFGAGVTPPTPYNRNQFGGSAGLPIIKDKLFLFGDYQGWREAVPINAYFMTVPTAKMRTGDFSELYNSSFTNGASTIYPLCDPRAGTPSSGQITDPITCQPFLGNLIPSNRQNPAASKYLNAFPLPTDTTRAFSNYLVSNQSQSVKYNNFDTRLDWHPSAKDQAFFRFSYDNSVTFKTNSFVKVPGLGGGDYTHARSYDLGETHTFTPNLVNEVHLGYNRITYAYTPVLYGVDVCTQLGIVNCNRNQLTSGGALIGGGGYEISYTGDYGTYTVPQNTYEINDTLNWEHGPHSFKFGATLIRRQVSYFSAAAAKGFFYIAYDGGDFTGFEDTELLVGATDQYFIGTQNGFYGQWSQEDGFFAQDDWRVTNRLTLNLGLRYDLLTWPYEMHNRASSFDVNTGTVLLAGQNGVPRSIMYTDHHDFSPRIGFAYRLREDGKIVLRGGYGLFYYLDAGGIGAQLDYQPPFAGAADYRAVDGYCITFTGQTATQGAPYTCKVNTDSSAVTNPLPAPGAQLASFNPQDPPAGLTMNSAYQHNNNSQASEYNLQLDWQVGANNVLDIAYVGTVGSHLSTWYPYNNYNFGTGVQNYPQFGGINYNVYNGISHYNGLQLHAEHRSGNLLTTGSYTWSHTLDDSTGVFSGSTVQLYYDPRSDYGNSNEDQRHYFSASIVYQLPFGRGQRYGGNVSRFMDWAIGGWQTSLIALVSSGNPFDLSTSIATPANRPDRIGPISYPKSVSGVWFNPSSFTNTTIPTVRASPTSPIVWGRLGTMRRNQIYGPGNRTVNLSVQKNLHLTDRFTLELHGDAFNVFNTPQFNNPGNNLDNPTTFGKLSSVKLYENRQIQLATRLTF